MAVEINRATIFQWLVSRLDTVGSWTLVGIVMILTGIGLPFTEFVWIESLLRLLGVTGFFLWSLSYVVGGLIAILIPRFMPVAFLPLIVWFLIQAKSALDGQGFTAVIYYTPVIIFPLYEYYRRRYPDRHLQSIINRIKPYQVIGLLNLLMAIVLSARPQTAGWNYIYSAIEPFLFDLIEPSTFMQLLFWIPGLILSLPARYTYLILDWITVGAIGRRDEHPPALLMLSIIPMAFPALFFTLTIAQITRAYAFLPMLVIVPLLYLITMRGYINHAGL